MKLGDCQYGVLVVDNDLNVGHIVGVTYNVGIRLTAGMTKEERLDATIPLVQFADGTRGIHHGNLNRYKG